MSDAGGTTECLELRLDGGLWHKGSLLPEGTLLVDRGIVRWAGPTSEAPQMAIVRSRSFSGRIIVPGFVDLHVHGARGFDFADGTAEAIAIICGAHARHGTTALCATLVSSGPEATLRALEAIRGATSGPPGAGARVLGAHLEGPFLNPAYAGAQPVAQLRAPDLALLEEFLAAAGPSLRIVTVAPELPGALALIERIVDHGAVAAIGHTGATFAETQAALRAGCRLGTHIFNAMRPIHHREPGVVGALLAEAATIEVIADGQHLAPAILRLLWRLKGPDRLALVTDCTAALECAPENARLGDQPVYLDAGAVRLGDGRLAGSVLTMAQAVEHLVVLGGAPLAGAIAAATTVPATLIGHGSALEPGQPADFLVLDETLQLAEVWIAGERLPPPSGEARR